jgi:N-acetylglucosaminyldiphosphoundecaprenol N-acetyl-beta-D-mannosaminyltransferase
MNFLSNALKRFNILGVSISSVNLPATVACMKEWIESNHKSYIVLTGVHGIIEMQKDDLLKSINNSSGLTTPDGMPVVWIGRSKGFKDIEKVYAPDIMLATFQLSTSQGYRHFFYGGNVDVADLLAKKMTDRFPGLNVVGTYCPPFRRLTPQEEEGIANLINAATPDIVWVGLGCPKQEYWMARYRPLLNAPVIIGVGAGFDFLSGLKPLAPNWIKNSGFEWLFRMVSDPRRLWPRYSRIVPKFLYLLTIELLFGRRPLSNKNS